MSSVMSIPKTLVGSKDKYLELLYWVLASICLWNLNGITSLAFGESRRLSVFILLAGLGMLFKSSARVPLKLSRSATAYVVFCVSYLLIGGASHVDWEIVVSQLNSIFIVVAIAIGTAALVVSNGLRLFVFRLQLFSAVGALTVLLSPFLQDIYARNLTTQLISNVGRWPGFFANPNEAGMACVYSFMVCIAAFQLSRNSKSKYISLALVVGLTVCVVLTFSRSSMLAFGIVGILYLGFSLEWNRKFVSGLFFGFLMLVGVYWFFTQGYQYIDWDAEQKQRIQSVERMITRSDARQSDFGHRGDALYGGIAYWSKSPVMGHGLGKMRAMPYRYFHGSGCHNTHLMVIGESGILGIAAYVVFWLVILHETARCPDAIVKRLCFALLTAFLFSGLADHGIFDNRNLNVLLGVVIGLVSYCKFVAPAKAR